MNLFSDLARIVSLFNNKKRQNDIVGHAATDLWNILKGR